MKGTVKWKRVIDVLMTLALFVQMAFQYTGELAHEVTGTAMLVLFLLHNALNFRWYCSLGRGRYRGFRMVQTAVNLLLLIDMLGLMISGIVMSRYVFRFLPISGGQYEARMFHLAGSHWGFLLMSVHLGLHWGMAVSAGKKLFPKGASHALRWGIRGAAFLAACMGAVSFWEQGFHQYLFLTNEFLFWDMERTVYQFLLQEVSMMGTCIFITYYGMRFLQKKQHKEKRINEKI